uniref:Chemokine interleukin-8-like domain-containing protein n=1 Tax=Poecilia latipinna TaxID=48699 RepID=A0A3B3TQF1_9TELE
HRCHGFVFRSSTFSSTAVWFSDGTGPIECCFQVCKNPVDIREIASFHMTDPLCPTSAAVLITKTAKHLCADPEEQWVKTIINFLEKKRVENQEC